MVNMSPQDLNIIDKYLNGELTPVEKNVFEKRKAEDPSFLEEVNFQQQLIEAIYAKERQGLRENIRQAQAQPDGKVVAINKIRFSLWKRLSIAAVFLILIGFVFYKINNPNIEPVEIANKYYEIDKSIFGSLKSVGQGGDALKSGVEALDKKRFSNSH